MEVLKRLFVFLLPFLALVKMAAGQEKELKKLSYPDFLKEIQTKTGVDTIKDIELVTNYSDTNYWVKINSEGKDVDHDVKIKELHVNCSVVFENCKINVWAETKLIFCDTLNESDTVLEPSIKFDNCNIKNYFLSGNFRYLSFTNCEINDLTFRHCFINYIRIENCKFSKGNTVDFRHCTFDCFPVKNNHLRYGSSVYFRDNENCSLFFYFCRFDPGKRSVLTSFGGNLATSFDYLIFRNCEFFKPVSFDIVKIESAIMLDHVKFDSNVSFQAFESPVSSTFFEWNALKNRLFSYDDVRIESKSSGKTAKGKDSLYFILRGAYYAKQDSELLNNSHFNGLLASYNFFTSLYTNNGDEESRNAVYLEKKQLLSARSKALYHHHKNIYNLITLGLNNFLSWFCDYATNPVKAILNCLKMLLLFALIYFIFPSQPDHLEKYRFMKYFKGAVEYFSTEKSLADIHKEAHHEHLKELEHFKLEMKKSKKLVPRIVTILGQLFYSAHYFVFNLFNKTLLSVDVCKRSWIHVSKGKKVVLGILTGIYFIGYVINGIITRVINALMLSLNSFVTLGAAGIETNGIAKVFTVIEGSVGWFFLAILTVTLITQLLQ